MNHFLRKALSHFFLEEAPAAGTGGTGAPAAGTGGTGTPVAAWYDTFQNPEVKTWVSSYKDAYPNPEAMATKAWNLEKFIGAEKAGKGVILPDFAKGKPEELRAFWNRVGAGAQADAYKVPQSLEKDPVMVKFRDHAFKVGMPLSHFNETAKFIEGEIKAGQDTKFADFERVATAEMAAVRQEWGAEYDSKVEAGRRAAAAFIPHENADQLQEIMLKMEGALGTKFVMNFWSNVGQKMGEHGFVQGDIPSGQMTPEAARIRITELKKDQEWGKKFAAGDVDAKNEWARLHRIGFPDQTPIVS